MKFAKELEDELVPEWRVKYFNYKIGKKKIKAVTRALRNVNRTPTGRPRETTLSDEDQLPFTYYDFNERATVKKNNATPQANDGGEVQVGGVDTGPVKQSQPPRAGIDRRTSLTMFADSPPVLARTQQDEQNSIKEENEEEHDADVERELEDDDDDDDDDDDLDDPSDVSSDSNLAQSTVKTPLQQRNPDGSYVRPYRKYGSISGSPPDSSPTEPLSTLYLPDPAMDPNKSKPPTERGPTLDNDSQMSPQVSRLQRTASTRSGTQKKEAPKRPTLSKRLFGRDSKRKEQSGSRARIKRAFTTLGIDSPGMTSNRFDAFRELDARQDEFFGFLDRELKKIEDFYKQKEDEATSRLSVLREQLHEMRDRRLEDLRIAKQGGKVADKGLLDGQIPIFSHAKSEEHHDDSKTMTWFEPVYNLFDTNGKIGQTSRAREELGSPRAGAIDRQKSNNDRGDYVRKQQPHEKVPYRNAKRKLKLAMQEFYRGLELLKSYTLLNRTAFRKINKKYDKAVMARPPLRYMSEKVNSAHFVQSTKVDEILVHIEDLYARYFERGNRKIAVSKLRSHLRQGDHSGTAFRNGLYVAAGLGFAVSGLLKGIPYLYATDQVAKTQASYLFQMYGGYLMAVMLFLFFILDCRIWAKNRVNYIFVFEYDTRHVLDWRQLAELPCFFLFLNGVFFWLNFQFSYEHIMYLWWPVILVVLTAVIICLPFKIFYYRARKWFLFSNWRLLLAGLYPVEFRDFFLGDMYCSETYTISQLEVFFCVYANGWNNPSQCNSSHSRLLGFLTCLPAIWRSFQCLRRYYDSRNWFPHLANFAKYLCNIMYYMSLSLYRIELNTQMRALMIVFAAINGIYCAFWDVFMDFSLGNPYSKNFLLRDNLAFRRKRYYYGVMILDVILRQQWIFYALFTHDLQHSAAMSFFVAMAEVIRRGVWSLFRVENEHCNNVAKFRASRDIPLPYSTPESRSSSVDYSRQPEMAQKPPPPDSPSATSTKTQKTDAQGMSSSLDLEHAQSSTSSNARKRRGTFSSSTPGLGVLQRVSNVIAAAHAQDFTKKKITTELVRSPHETGREPEWSEDEDADAIEEAEDQRRVDGDSPRHRRRRPRDPDDQGTGQRASSDIEERDFQHQPRSSQSSPQQHRRRPRRHTSGEHERSSSHNIHHTSGHASGSNRRGGHAEPSTNGGSSGGGSGGGRINAVTGEGGVVGDDGILAATATIRRNRVRPQERTEREIETLRQASEMNDIDTAEASDLVARARGTT